MIRNIYGQGKKLFGNQEAEEMLPLYNSTTHTVVYSKAVP